MTIESNRTLGGLGALLTVVGVFSSVFSIIRFAYPNNLAADIAFSGISGVVGVISFVGFILFLVAMYGFSRDYKENKIFNYIIYGIVITIITTVVIAAIGFVFIFANMGAIIASWTTNPSQSDLLSSLIPYLAPFIAIFGFIGLINVVFNLLAFNLLSNKSGVPLFRNGASVLLLGALVTIVIGVVLAAFAAGTLISFENIGIITLPGALLQDVGWLLLALAFFRVKPATNQTLPRYIENPPPAPFEAKNCPNCGAQNLHDAIYCTTCGKKIQSENSN